MEILSTKFASEDIDEIGIHGNVLALFTLLGWQHVMYASRPTYGRIRLEFFGTVEVLRKGGIRCLSL